MMLQKSIWKYFFNNKIRAQTWKQRAQRLVSSSLSSAFHGLTHTCGTGGRRKEHDDKCISTQSQQQV